MSASVGNIPANATLLVAFDDWLLFARPVAARDGWHSLKLVWTGMTRLPKGNYWFGWNGQRLARGKDIGLLAEHQSELHQQVVAWLVANLPASSPKPETTA